MGKFVTQLKQNMSPGVILRTWPVFLLGCLLYGIGLSWFLIPYKVAPGGVGGISQLFFHFLGFKPGLTMILMNIPLWILGMVVIGRQFGMGTFIGFFLSSLATDLVSPARLYGWNIFVPLIEKYNTLESGALKEVSQWAMTDNVFLAAVAGSLLLGAGLGLIFKGKASTGGTDIPVAILKKKLNISIGNGYLILETGIILLTGLLFGDLNLIIWSFFALFLSSKVVDIVTEGLSKVKTAMIICTNPDAEERIKERIFDELDRGCTFLKGAGAYTREPKNIIYVAFSIRQVAALRNICLEEDPDVFLVTQEGHDVTGFGFKSRGLEL